MKRLFPLCVAMLISFVAQPALADEVDEVIDDLVRYRSQIRAERELEREGFTQEAVRAQQPSHYTIKGSASVEKTNNRKQNSSPQKSEN